MPLIRLWSPLTFSSAQDSSKLPAALKSCKFDCCVSGWSILLFPLPLYLPFPQQGPALPGSEGAPQLPTEHSHPQPSHWSLVWDEPSPSSTVELKGWAWPWQTENSTEIPWSNLNPPSFSTTGHKSYCSSDAGISPGTKLNFVLVMRRK